MITVFKGSEGLNTKIDPARIKFTQSSGIHELAVAYNVDIDDTGRVSRRKGFTPRVTGISPHSLFCDGGECLFVYSDALCILNGDYTYTELRNVTEGAPMSCYQVNDEIYYCNGHEKGIVRNSLSWDWEKGDYVGADSHRNLTDPPIGTHVAYYNGRMYVVQGPVLWFSEPYAFGAFDSARGYVSFAHNIRMVRPVDKGIWVGTERETFFLPGDEPKAFAIVRVASYPPMEWSDCRLQGRMVQYKDGGLSIDTSVSDNAAMWVSPEGICFGGAAGEFYNVTKEKIDLPSGLTGSGVVIGGRFVGLINP